MITGLALGLWLAAGPAAEPRVGSGLAGYAGVGAHTGGYGLAVGYYQRLGSGPWYLAPYVGGGFSFDAALAGVGIIPAWSAGTMLIRGRVHRAVLALNYGPIYVQPYGLHETVIGGRAINGPMVGLGYELNRGGYLFEVIPALAYPIDRILGPSQRRPRLTVSLVGGWKFW